MKTINVKIITKAGERHQYTGLFASTIDAVLDAIERFDIRNIYASCAA